MNIWITAVRGVGVRFKTSPLYYKRWKPFYLSLRFDRRDGLLECKMQCCWWFLNVYFGELS